MNTSIRQFSAVIAAFLMLASSLPAQAQDAFTAQESLELFVGDIFEITPSHNLQNPTYTWILTQDRTFIEAGRAETFRKRLITPGRYTLYAEISGNGQNLSRTFVLDYKARVPGQQPVTATGSAGALVRTSPPADEQGRVILPESSQLLKLEPVNPDLRPVIADLDLNTDSDGDGDPANDIDTDITFFQTDATPLYVWIAEPITVRPMSVTVARPEGAQQQLLEVYSESHASALGITNTPSTVNIEKTGNRTYSFSASFPSGIDPETPLLYHWEFGDGQQSLLANPTHQYASEGTYEVKLRIRNLTDGRDIAMYTEQITVEPAANPEPVIEQPAEETPAEEPAGSGMGIGSMLLLAGIFIASILLGIGVIILLAKMRGRGKSFSDTIEKMEQTIVKKDDKSGNPPPLTIAPPAQSPKPQTPPPEIAQREQSNNSQNPAQQQTPKVEEKNAPAWLKSGLAGQQSSAPAAPQNQQAAPTPKPQQTPPQAAQQNQQGQTKSSAPQQTQRAQGTPPWLQQKSAAPQTTMPAKPATPAQPQAPQQNNQNQPKPTAPAQTTPQNQQAAPTPKPQQTPPPAPQQNQLKPAPSQQSNQALSQGPSQAPAQTTLQNQLASQSPPTPKPQQTPPPVPQQNQQSQVKPPQPTGPSSPTNQPKPAQQQTQYVPAWLQTPAATPQAQQGSSPTPQPAQPQQQPSQQTVQQPATPPAQQNQASAASPAPSQTPQQQNTPPADQPVAFIRADSLNVPQKENNQNPPPQSGQSA